MPEPFQIQSPALPTFNVRAYKQDVLQSGVAHTDAEGMVEFVAPNFHVIFRFITDEKAQRIEFSVINEGKSLETRVYNFNASIGTGLISPVSLGVFNGRPLSVIFTVYSLSPKSAKLFIYTFLQG
jgi:Domain of unknown function (DUF6864)